MSTNTQTARDLARRAEHDDSRDHWFRTRDLAKAIYALADECDQLQRVLDSRTEHSS